MSNPFGKNRPANLSGAPHKTRPHNYEILLINESAGTIGPSEVSILTDIFNMTLEEAFGHAFFACFNGASPVFVSTFEVVETKKLEAEERRQLSLRRDPHAGYIEFVAARLG
jgi:ATP-dependent Clp protease adapter protein ClpS